ncbi:MAG: hypothetical protein JXK94_02475 [Deltaproteobacteria bacterium]|nr:hypothetical protein [Deltaproteobacteria bacterium]
MIIFWADLPTKRAVEAVRFNKETKKCLEPGEDDFGWTFLPYYQACGEIIGKLQPYFLGSD